VIRMGVRVDALEVRPEGQFDHLELGQLREDAVPADPLAAVRPIAMPSTARVSHTNVRSCRKKR
jgi:hypothetical protein